MRPRRGWGGARWRGRDRAARAAGWRQGRTPVHLQRRQSLHVRWWRGSVTCSVRGLMGRRNGGGMHTATSMVVRRGMASLVVVVLGVMSLIPPVAPQVWPQYGVNNPMTAVGSGRQRDLSPEMMLLHTAGTFASPSGSSGIEHVPPSFYFTSPYDYEQDDAAAPSSDEAADKPDSWFDRVHKATGVHRRTYDAISQGQMPRMGYMGTGVHRPINPLIEAQELSDIDPWKQMATQRYAFFRSPARNPEMRGETLRRLSKSAVLGFDHTNGQYGLPLGTGLRGVGAASMGLTKFDYGPYGLGTIHPSPFADGRQLLYRSLANQAAAPLGAAALLGVPAGPLQLL